MPNELLQRYSRHVYFNEEDQDYIALCSEFKHLSAFGGTPEDALQELNEVLEAALEIHAEEGWPIPRPEAPPEPEGLPSGRFVTRLPKTLHARLIRQARGEGVSQNQLVMSYVAAGLGAAGDQEPASAKTADEAAWGRRQIAHENSPTQSMALVSAQDSARQSPDEAVSGHPPSTQDTSDLALTRP